MMHTAKTFFVNLVATLVTFAACWGGLSLFDDQTGRAGIYAACLAFINLAWGLRSWERSAQYLDTFRLIGYFMLAAGLVVALLVVDMLWQDQEVGSAVHIYRYVRSRGFASWLFLFSQITAWVVLPFMLASIVRAIAIGIMRNVFGAKPFGLASAEQVEDYEERESRLSGIPGGNFLAVAAMVVFWPGIWAIKEFRHGKVLIGVVTFCIWAVAFVAVCVFLQRRYAIRLYVSLPCSVVALVAVGSIFWN